MQFDSISYLGNVWPGANEAGIDTLDINPIIFYHERFFIKMKSLSFT